MYTDGGFVPAFGFSLKVAPAVGFKGKLRKSFTKEEPGEVLEQAAAKG